MLPRPLSVVFLSAMLCFLAPAQTPNQESVPSNSAPAATQPPRPTLTPEQRGDLYMVRKMYREAVESFRQAPPTAVIWNKMGIAYHQMQQLEEARKCYLKAVRLDPKFADGLNNVGTVYYAKKSYGRAIGYYQRALKLSPNSATMYSNLGTAYFARKQYKQASEYYQKALELDPQVFENRNTYGELLQDRNVQERAKFHYYLAKTYAKAGMNDRALEYLRKALEEGFREKNKLREDPEFNAMRDLPEFQELLNLEPRVL
jgi:tetratricopeptide (TPR) repeat protein